VINMTREVVLKGRIYLIEDYETHEFVISPLSEEEVEKIIKGESTTTGIFVAAIDYEELKKIGVSLYEALKGFHGKCVEITVKVSNH